MKIIIPIIAVLAVIAGGVYFFFFSGEDGESSILNLGGSGNGSAQVLQDIDVDFARLYSVWDLSFTEYEDVWLLGKYEGVDMEVGAGDQFVLTDRTETMMSNVDVNVVEGSGSLTMDSYVLVEGEYDDLEYNVVNASAFSVVDEDTYEELMKKRFPFVEIKILEDTLEVSHGCENVSVQVSLRNIGEVPIDYQKTDIDTPNGAPYVFKSILDGEVFSIYPDSMFDEDSGPVGYKDGFRDFGVLEPGQEKEVRYGLSGEVRSAPGGTAGTSNIFCRNEVDGDREFRIEFGNVHPSDRGLTVSSQNTFVHTSTSNTIDVEIGTCECLLDVDSLPEPLE